MKQITVSKSKLPVLSLMAGRLKLVSFILILLVVSGCNPVSHHDEDVYTYAKSRISDLQLATYITAGTVQSEFAAEAGRREAVSLLRANGITKVYVEIHRNGLIVPIGLLSQVVTLLENSGFEVVGGIATLPGKGVGVPQDGVLGWLNWQNPKTREDMKKIIEDAAPLFNELVLDDFFCTSDTSLESKQAKGNRSWSEYRRELMDSVAQSVIIEPARSKNPNIVMTIKFPQWYDKFHQFGYDVATEPDLFDKVLVGTETRGQYTPRFGYVQPYEGFINYRWITTLAEGEMEAAWFDHIDCTAKDYVDQAYQSVLAGATELSLFNFNDILKGHPGDHLLRLNFEKLADLAVAVAENPITGPAGYKPPNSTAGDDLYLMDYIGMFGTSLVPVSTYPEKASVIFLPTQAATDSAIAEKIIRSVKEGKKLVMTTGFLAHVKNGSKLAELAGIKYPLIPEQHVARTVLNNGKVDSLAFPLQTDYKIVPDGARVLLQTPDEIPFLTGNKHVSVINTHTFSQADFDAVGEVLLCPTQIGLLELPQKWANAIRSVFLDQKMPKINAPTRVTFQMLKKDNFVVQNYNQQKVEVEIQLKNATGNLINGFTGQTIPTEGGTIKLEMKPRSRVWIQTLPKK